MLLLRVLKDVKVRFEDREITCTALFDTGSGFTVVSRGFLEKNFGARWSPLPRPVKLYLVDGRFVIVDKYVEVIIVVDDIELLPPETALVLDEFAEEVVVEGRRVKMPDMIVGSGTMDKYGIVLDPREGVKVIGGSPLL
ncbi:MAG: retropepsin-like aspartic protease [Acidilobaceae archaeon]